MSGELLLDGRVIYAQSLHVTLTRALRDSANAAAAAASLAESGAWKWQDHGPTCLALLGLSSAAAAHARLVLERLIQDEAHRDAGADEHHSGLSRGVPQGQPEGGSPVDGEASA